jgi:hypothetical protein
MRNLSAGVYLGQSAEKIHATTALYRHFKTFMTSEAMVMSDPLSGWGFYLSKDQARAKLRWLLHVAINRKAGLPDVPSKKHTDEYQVRLARDVRRVRACINHRVVVHQFETDMIRKRYRHLQSDYRD